MIYVESKRFMNHDFRKLLASKKTLKKLQQLVNAFRKVIDESHIATDNLVSNAEQNYKLNLETLKSSKALLVGEMQQHLVMSARSIGIDNLGEENTDTRSFNFSDSREDEDTSYQIKTKDNVDDSPF